MSDPFIGEIRMFGGNFAPLGWAFCNGQLLSIPDFDALFTLIGTTYGGDGQNTFGLPNLASRFPIHTGKGFTQGQLGGSQSVTLSVGQLPAHSHIASGAVTGTTNSPGGNFWAGASSLAQFVEGTAANETMNAGTLQPSGNNLPHDNMMPYLALNFIIALAGIFPSQN
jgi:microcystin-dependent protein